MNHLKIEKDFRLRGYSTPKEYFKDFSKELPFPKETMPKRTLYERLYYPFAAVLILLLGIGLFIQNGSNSSPASLINEMSFEEEILVYDSSFDFETSILSMLDDSDLESSLFADIEVDVLEDYVDDFSVSDDY